jgi:hypothetical protein
MKLSDNKILIVLGMHRSGTSLTANWLEKCGLNIGDDLVGPYVGNSEGHFEDLDFHSLHEKIFKRHGIQSGGLRGKLSFTLSEQDKKDIRALVRRKAEKYEQWGWKEPRTCLFLEAYQEALPNAKHFIVFRDYTEVVDSLLRREYKLLRRKTQNSFIARRLNLLYRLMMKLYQPIWKLNNKKIFLRTWIKYNSELLKNISSIEKEAIICISLEDLITNDQPIIQHLKSWGFDLQYFPVNKIFKEKLLKKKVDIRFPGNLKKEADQILSSLQQLSYGHTEKATVT